MQRPEGCVQKGRELGQRGQLLRSLRIALFDVGQGHHVSGVCLLVRVLHEFGLARTRLQYARQYLRHGSRTGRPSRSVIVGPGRERHVGSVLLPLREQLLQSLRRACDARAGHVDLAPTGIAGSGHAIAPLSRDQPDSGHRQRPATMPGLARVPPHREPLQHIKHAANSGGTCRHRCEQVSPADE